MISAVIPKLPFIDKQKTINFYVSQLKFSLIDDYGDYFIIKLHEIEIHFFSFKDLIPNKSDFMIYIRVTNGIETYYNLLQQLGVSIHPNSKLETKPWNQKEFAILDPNGTLLTFGQSL